MITFSNSIVTLHDLLKYSILSQDFQNSPNIVIEAVDE